MRRIVPSAILIASLFTTVLAAPNPATRPAERAKFVFTVPPGFEKVEAAGHTAVCEPDQVAWVKKAMTDMKPASRPSTLPTDIIQRATSSRDPIIKGIQADLGIADEKALGEFYDTRLLPTLKKYDALKPPVYYLVITRDKLRELTKQRWGEPRFLYSQASDLPVWDETVMLSIERPVEEAVVVYYLESKYNDEERTQRFVAGIADMDKKIQTLISEQAQLDTFNMISQHMGRNYLEPLKLRRDQMWLPLGSAAVIASKYTSILTGESREQLIQEIVREEIPAPNPDAKPRKHPVSSGPIDLVKPMDESALRPAAMPYYTQAMRRKATAAVSALVKKAGDGAIARILTAVKQTPPADGPALVKLIKDLTGVDPTPDLAPKAEATTLPFLPK